MILLQFIYFRTMSGRGRGRPRRTVRSATHPYANTEVTTAATTAGPTAVQTASSSSGDLSTASTGVTATGNQVVDLAAVLTNVVECQQKMMAEISSL